LLDVIDLECSRGDRPLFRDLSFSVKSGDLLHIIGSNGSGKTTLLRTLCGLSRPSAGTIHWSKTKIRHLGDDYRSQLAYVGHSNGIQGELTPVENLRLAACLAGRCEAPVMETLTHLALDAYRHFPAKILSQGQKRRLALARLAIAEKPLWILDEPLTALDTLSSGLVINMITGHLAGGGMVILTSHQELSLDVVSMLQISLDALAVVLASAP